MSVPEPTYPAGDPQIVYDAFDQLPVLICALTGPEHAYAAGNAAFRAFIGDRDFIGRPVREVFPEVAGQQIVETCDRVFTSGVPTTVPQWRTQLDYDRTGVLVERFADISLVPLRDSTGSVYGVSGWFVDVTDQVRQRRADEQRATEAERRYEAARDVVADLQEALLPAALPVLPGATVAARYLVAARDHTAGGDWFDAIPLPDGRVGLVVGDVVGHGVTASAAMGQLRAVLREVLLETGDLDQALAWADRMAARSPVMRAATICAAVLDPVTGALRYSTCGHPPPLVVTPEGKARYLPRSGGEPLGTGAPVAWATELVRAGELLMLYSDGLIERPGVLLDERRGTLAQVAGDAILNRGLPIGAPASAVERVCQTSVELLTREGYDDDVTVLAAQRRLEPVPIWRAQRPAVASELADLRIDLNRWLGLCGASRKDQQAIDLAVSELAANVVEHAYPDGSTGPLWLRAELTPDGAVTIDVIDHGVWRTPQPPASTSGRGLWMAGAIVDELFMDHLGGNVVTDVDDELDDDQPPNGTVVTLWHRLTHPAQLVASRTTTPERAATLTFATHLDDGPPTVVHVDGAVDISTAAQLADRLGVATRGGVHPVTVDLTNVDLLARAGVRVLFEMRDQLATHGHQLVLIAENGTPAQQVLDLVGLPHPSPPA